MFYNCESFGKSRVNMRGNRFCVFRKNPCCAICVKNIARQSFLSERNFITRSSIRVIRAPRRSGDRQYRSNRRGPDLVDVLDRRDPSARLYCHQQRHACTDVGRVMRVALSTTIGVADHPWRECGSQRDNHAPMSIDLSDEGRRLSRTFSGESVRRRWLWPLTTRKIDSGRASSPSRGVGDGRVDPSNVSMLPLVCWEYGCRRRAVRVLDAPCVRTARG